MDFEVQWSLFPAIYTIGLCNKLHFLWFMVPLHVKQIPFLLPNVKGFMLKEHSQCKAHWGEKSLKNDSGSHHFWQNDLYQVIKLRAEVITVKKTTFAYLSSSKPNLVSHLFQNEVILIFSDICSTLCYKSYSTIQISCLMLHIKINSKSVEPNTAECYLLVCHYLSGEIIDVLLISVIELPTCLCNYSVNVYVCC